MTGAAGPSCLPGRGVPVAAGVLYRLPGILVSPIFAAAVMRLSSFLAIANTLMFRSVKIGRSRLEFGAVPDVASSSVPGVTGKQIKWIVKYAREIQRASGIN